MSSTTKSPSTSSPSSPRSNGKSSSKDYPECPLADHFLQELPPSSSRKRKKWCEQLAARRKPLLLSKRCGPVEQHPLTWGGSSAGSPVTLSLLERKRPEKSSKSSKWTKLTEEWLAASSRSAIGVDAATEYLAWAHALPCLATRLAPDLWNQMAERLLNTVEQNLDPSKRLADSPEAFVVDQLLVGELPLTLAYWFPKSPTCQQLAGPAREVISQGLVEILDGEGVPHGRYVAGWRAHCSPAGPAAWLSIRRSRLGESPGRPGCNSSGLSDRRFAGAAATVTWCGKIQPNRSRRPMICSPPHCGWWGIAWTVNSGNALSVARKRVAAPLSCHNPENIPSGVSWHSCERIGHPPRHIWPCVFPRISFNRSWESAHNVSGRARTCRRFVWTASCFDRMPNGKNSVGRRMMTSTTSNWNWSCAMVGACSGNGCWPAKIDFC